MIKYLFAAIILIHGLIHLMGFVKSVKPGSIQQITAHVSKPMGLLWLLTALLFLIVFILWIVKNNYWSWVCFAAIIASQILVFSVWKDAKAGTIANLILLMVALPAYGHMRFDKMVGKEQQAIMAHETATSMKMVGEQDMVHLPAIVQQWLRKSGAVGKPRITTVRLKQTGKMKMKPVSAWFDFTATQYFNTTKTAFVWDTRVSMPAGTYLIGRDKFEDGKGAMQIKLLSLVNMVNEADNTSLNNGTAQRYLAEMCWFPSAALEPYIRWQAIDSLQAKATLLVKNVQVEGVFSFTPEGDFARFETKRYFGSGENAVERTWVIEPLGQKQFSGITIPHRNKVTWKLPEGDFTWLELEITDIEYNKAALYD